MSESTTDSALYRILVTYEYEFAGRWYGSSRYGFSTSATAGRWGKKRTTHRLAPGTATICYVNPENPSEAVIERGVTWDMVLGGVSAIIFFAVFLFLLRHGAV